MSYQLSRLYKLFNNYLLFSFPIRGTGREYDGITTAVDMAESMINNNPNILPGYKLAVKRVHCECKPDIVLRHFINYYSHRKHLVGVLGPCK